MRLDVILRTHDSTDIHSDAGESRYCGVSKTTLIDKCAESLITSIEQFQSESKWDVSVYWIDDGSSDECRNMIRDRFMGRVHLVEMNLKRGHGFNASALSQFQTAMESEANLVYLVEDDYLHYPSAITEMVDAYLTFKTNLGAEVAIHPFDDPDNYLPTAIEPCRIVYGRNRHWRTNTYSTFTVMFNPEVIREYWSVFYTLATEYRTQWGERNNVHEGTTINELWRGPIPLFTPIPSLALHMQFTAQKDPYLSWKALWNSLDGKKL